MELILLRFFALLLLLCVTPCALTQQPALFSAPLPEAPLPNAPLPPIQPTDPQILLATAEPEVSSGISSSDPFAYSFYPAGSQTSQASEAAQQPDKPVPGITKPQPLDANGTPIPLDRQQPQRILGFMPNFRSVAGGSQPHAPGWGYNFKIATRQSFDYSSFIFLGLTSLAAEGIEAHDVLGKGVHGFYAYTWRGLLDKTDGTYLGAWLLPSLLHEDTRYYALGKGHTIPTRIFYVISRQAVTRTYGGRQTPNISGLGSKVLTQYISRYYYPAGSSTFQELAIKFGYSAMRDVAFTSVREFYPDIAAHYIRKHREKVAAQAAQDATSAGAPAVTQQH